MASLNCCSICGKKFKRPSALRLHQVVHTGEKSFECSICNAKLSQKGSLQRHIASKHAPSTTELSKNQNHGGIQNIVLESLKNVRSNILELEANANSRTSPRINKPSTFQMCLLKDKLNPQKKVNNLPIQRVKHEGDKKYYYVCDYCGKQFLKSYDLIRHRRAHTKESPYPCSYCLKSLKTKSQLEQHLKVHKFNNETGIISHQFSCQICNKNHSSKRQLRIHMQSDHKDSFLYNCNKCTSTFKTQAAYEAHMKNELDTELSSLESIIPQPQKKLLNTKHYYQCLYCVAIFPNKFNCRSHMRTHVKRLLDGKNEIVATTPAETIGYVDSDKRTNPNNIQPKPCTYCSKTFRKPNDLERHLRTHNGEKPFPCTICEKTFSLKSSLNRHILTHAECGQNPKIDCQFCGRQFASKSSLNVHLRLHTGKMPFQCQICSKTFRTSGHKAAHMKTGKH